MPRWRRTNRFQELNRPRIISKSFPDCVACQARESAAIGEGCPLWHKTRRCRSFALTLFARLFSLRARHGPLEFACRIGVSEIRLAALLVHHALESVQTDPA